LRKCENVLNWLPQGPLAPWVKWSAVYKFGDLVKQTGALLGFKEQLGWLTRSWWQ
jgi:hypothetical protein